MRIAVHNQVHLSSSTFSLRNTLGRSGGGSQGKKISQSRGDERGWSKQKYVVKSLSLFKKWMYTALVLLTFREGHTHI